MPKKLFVTQSDRMQKIPPFLFGQLAKKKSRFKSDDIIDLGRAIPDLDPPQQVRDEMAAWVSSNANFYQSAAQVKMELKKEFALWFGKRYGVELDPQKEVLLMPGQREGINLVALGLVNSGEKVLICDPAFPIYRSAASLAEAEIVILPLLERNDFLPNFALPHQTLNKARLLLLNYPNTPTTGG